MSIRSKAKLQQLEKEVKRLGKDTWYEIDWSNWSNEELKMLRDLGKDKESRGVKAIQKDEEFNKKMKFLFDKVAVEKVHPMYSVPSGSLAYISVDRVREMQKTFPNVKL